METGTQQMDLSLILKRKFKRLSNKDLIARINRKFANDENDDDEVFELFRRRDEQGFKVKVGFDTYELEEENDGTKN